VKAVGLFDKFKQYREDQHKKSAEKAGDLLKNKVTTKDQRLEAIESLAGMPAEIAFPQLMKRYEMVIDHGILDTREKEMIEEILCGKKEVAQPIIRAALAKSARISWPIRIAEKLFERGEYVELLIQSLNMDPVLFDESVNERNVELLLALKEVDHPEAVERAAKLVHSRDEHVRMAALECLESRATSSPEAKNIFLGLLKEEASDTNSRFLGLVRSIAQRHAWI
jgi:HEAT repeat protein